MPPVSPHLDRLAPALLAGAALATLAVTFAPALYYDAIEIRLLPEALPLLTPRRLVTEGLMALFLFALGKEFFESLRLEGGLFADPLRRRLLGPALALALALPLVVWTLTGAPGWGDLEGAMGWSLCLGADLGLAWALGRRVFGRGHPALGLLLFLAIALDMLAILGIGLESLALALAALLPSPEVEDGANRLAGALRLVWLLPAIAIPLIYRRKYGNALHGRALAPILITAALTWICLMLSGLPGALALLPLIPLIPHAPRALGLFAEAEARLKDPLNRMEAAILPLLPVIAFLFGLTCGAIDFAALNADTGRTLFAVALRPLGLYLGARLALAVFDARLPPGMDKGDLARLCLLLGPGLTLPLLGLDQTAGGLADGARVGLALSLLLALPAFWPRKRP